MTISQNIKSARTASGLTQEALARKLDVSLMTISRWENGATPTADKIVPIAAALNVSPAEILSETQTKPESDMNAKNETERVVGVWYDETPELEYRAWVVADEDLRPDGSTDYTTTIRAFGADRAAAVEFGRVRARQRGVRLAIQD
jgi:transcriptional regulator with XRE-family HTH domain